MAGVSGGGWQKISIFLDTEGRHLHNAFDQKLIALLSLINESNKYTPALTGKMCSKFQHNLYVREFSRPIGGPILGLFMVDQESECPFLQVLS